MSPEEELIRAGDAKSVIDSTIFTEARKQVLEGIQSQMRRAPVADNVMHTRLILTLQLWTALEDYLNGIVQTGEIAHFQIEEEKKRRRFFGT